MSVVYLARHGQTAYNAEGRFQGRAPVPLDATGREQAHALAERVTTLGPLRTFLCSPLERARETAQIVGRRIGMRATPDDRFAETDVGDWEHKTYAEVDPGLLEQFARTDAAFAFPGGESFAHHLERVRDGLSDLLDRDGRDERLPALVVCHGGTIRLALTAWGDPEGRGWHMENTALVTLHADGSFEK